MTSTSLPLFGSPDNATQAAYAVHRLMNSAPHTPSVSEVADVIGTYMVPARLDTPEQSWELRAFLAMSNDTCEGLADSEVNALTTRMNTLEATIIAKPLRTTADLAELGVLVGAMMLHTGIQAGYPACAEAISKLAIATSLLHPQVLIGGADRAGKAMKGWAPRASGPPAGEGLSPEMATLRDQLNATLAAIRQGEDDDPAADSTAEEMALDAEITRTTSRASVPALNWCDERLTRTVSSLRSPKARMLSRSQDLRGPSMPPGSSRSPISPGAREAQVPARSRRTGS